MRVSRWGWACAAVGGVAAWFGCTADDPMLAPGSVSAEGGAGPDATAVADAATVVRERTLFWLESSQIHRARLTADETLLDEVIVHDDDAGYPTGLALDDARQTLYWSDNALDGILRAGFDGGNPTSLFDAGDRQANPNGVAVMPGLQNLFWIEWAGAEGSRWYVADLDGQNRVSFATDGGFLTGIAVDPQRQVVYLSDNARDAVLAYRVDGQLVTEYAMDAGNAQAVSVDATSGQVFFALGHDLWTAPPDGGAPQRLATIPVNGDFTGIAVDGVARRIFYTENGRDSITAIDYDGANGAVLHHAGGGGSNNVNGVALSFR